MLPIQPLVRSQPLQRYTFQMLQALLRGPIFPQTSYSLQSLAAKQALWTESAAKFSAEMYRDAGTLGVTASLLIQENQTSLVNQRRAFSSDRSKVSAHAMKGAAETSHTVEVSALAKAQINQSLSLPAEEKSDIQAGTNRFHLNMGGQQHLISVYSSATDTNFQSLTRIATAINAEHTGVKANVNTDSRTGNVRLMLTASMTGSDHSFTLADVEGNAVAAADLIHTTTSAQDARYKLDGQFHSTSRNIVRINREETELTLLQTTQVPVTVTIRPDSDAIVRQTKQFLDAYNRFHVKLESSTAVFSVDLTQGWDRLTASIGPQLARIGITRNSDGTFAISEEKMRLVMKQNSGMVVRSLGHEGGLAAKIKDQADRLHDIPLAWLSQPSPYSYSRNPYHAYFLPTLFLQQAAKTGLFFNQAL